ncbi:hypothetical protein D3C75_1274550 [compost metagenome]
MNGNAEITAMILLDRTNQRTNNFSFILSNYNEIGIPRKLPGERLDRALETFFR